MYRAEIALVGSQVKALKEHDFFESKQSDKNYPKADQGEMQENLSLAYRHLEDARMRLGKVIQALEGGKSVYDKQATG